MKKNEECNMFIVYILYSPSLSKYYVGSTSMDISERLARHLHEHQGFTSRAKDWEVIYTEKYDDKTAAFVIGIYDTRADSNYIMGMTNQ